MGLFVDFWVGIPQFAGNMKLIFICFALLTHVVLLLCFCYSIGRLPDAMGTTECAKPLPKCHFYF